MSRALTLMVCTALALAGCVSAARDRTAYVQRVTQPDLLRRIYLRPALPRVGDSLELRAVLYNRGPRVREVVIDCMPPQFREQLPIDRPPPDTGPLANLELRCLAIEQRTLAPGDSAVLGRVRWGPLRSAGRYPVFVILNYGPGEVDTATVLVHVRSAAKRSAEGGATEEPPQPH